jgi:hypothetical protein
MAKRIRRKTLRAQELADIYFWRHALGKSASKIGKMVGRSGPAISTIFGRIDDGTMTYGNEKSVKKIPFGHLEGRPWPTKKNNDEIVVGVKLKDNAAEPEYSGQHLSDIQGLILHLTESNIPREMKMRIIGELL